MAEDLNGRLIDLVRDCKRGFVGIDVETGIHVSVSFEEVRFINSDGQYFDPLGLTESTYY